MKRKVLAIILMCSMLLVTGCGAVGGTTVATETTDSIPTGSGDHVLKYGDRVERVTVVDEYYDTAPTLVVEYVLDDGRRVSLQGGLVSIINFDGEKEYRDCYTNGSMERVE